MPEFDRKTWDLRVEGLVEDPIKMTYDELISLKKTESISDFHCVTGWSRFDNKWEGVLFRDIAYLVKPESSAHFGYYRMRWWIYNKSSLSDLMEPDVLLAYAFNGEPLESAHGGPLRLVVPKKYAYKCAKWVRQGGIHRGAGTWFLGTAGIQQHSGSVERGKIFVLVRK